MQAAPVGSAPECEILGRLGRVFGKELESYTAIQLQMRKLLS